jgi:predicted nucleic-acid-binding Zn-ribbon protein
MAKEINMGGGGAPKLNITLDKTTPITCDNCGGQVFTEGLIIRKASKFLTGTAQDSIIPIPTFACTQCGHVNQEFLPKELQTQKTDTPDA